MRLKNFKSVASVFIMSQIIPFSLGMSSGIAGPNIYNVSSVDHGNQATISGSNFGTKPTSAPILFEQFEDNKNHGDLLSSGGVWQLPNGNGVTYNSGNQRSQFSSLNAIDKMKYGGKNGKFQKNVFNSYVGRKFISFWTYIKFVNLSAKDNWQHKVWRIESGPSHADYPSISLEQWSKPNGSRDRFYYEAIGTTFGNIWSGQDIPAGEWVNVQVELKDSSSLGATDASLRITTLRPNKGRFQSFVNNKVSRTSGKPGVMSWVKFGYLVTNNLNNGHEVHSAWDDIYIDNSWSRVEIGNKQDYNACTHREVQRVTNWSGNGNSITFKVNQGSFANHANAYLFVVDSSGNASQGLPITFGAASGGTDSQPGVAFSSPTTGTSHTDDLTDSSAVVNITGTAWDDGSVANVVYSTNNGQSGTASSSNSFSNWSVPITINKNETVVTNITVTDNSGKTSTKSLTLTDIQPVIWAANAQTGDSTWSNSSVKYCVRLLVQGSEIDEDASQVVLSFKGRTSGNYQIRNVSIAERDVAGLEGDVIDSTWTKVTFSGNNWSTATTINANSLKLSDPASIRLKSGYDYYVTFKIDSPSVYLDPPSGYKELYFSSEDHTGDVDWGTNGHGVTQDYHALAEIYSYSSPVDVSTPIGFSFAPAN